MLLADWVFAQSPKAVVEISNTLAAPDTLRRLLPDTSSYRGEQPIQIPSRCGGSEILRGAFELLTDLETRDDLARRLAAFISVNGTQEEIDADWRASRQGQLFNDNVRWLWIGKELGSLARADKSTIMADIGDSPLTRDVVALFCETNRYDCVLTSRRNALEMKSYILSTIASKHSFEIGTAPLYLLPALLSPDGWGDRELAYRSRYLFNALTKFKSLRAGAAELDLEFPFDFVEQVFDLSCKIANLIENEAPNARSAVAWESLVEDCVGMWGEEPAILITGIRLAEGPRGTRGRLRRAPLFDRNHALCDRLRSAKAQAKKPEWWKSQLLLTKEPRDRFLFFLCYCIWAPPSVMFEMADEIAVTLDSMPFEEWSALLDAVLPLLDRACYVSTPDKNGAEPLPRGLDSPRLALLIGLRDEIRYGRSVFMDYLVDDAERHLVVSEFRQSHAFEAAGTEVLDWRSALLIIRSTYAEGAAYRLMRMTRRQGTVKLPETISQQILANARDFPVFLWELAERVASANARKAVRPVAQVAKQERWFDA